MIEDQTTSTTTVWILFVLWVILVLLLVYLYKRLNRETDGQYTIRQIVYGKGGVRDRVRGGVVVIEAWLGLHLWPRNEDEEAVGEEDEDRDEEGDVERGSKRGGSDGGVGGNESEGRGDDSSDDYSSMEGCDLRERVKLTDAKEERRVSEGKREEKKVEQGDGEGKESRAVGAEGGEGRGCGGLLIDLKQFSGSAIWSEENSEVGNDVTEL